MIARRLVVESSGAVVSGARIEVSNVGTNVVSRGSSDPQGNLGGGQRAITVSGRLSW